MSLDSGSVTLALRLPRANEEQESVQIANRDLGLYRVLLTCDDDNVGSIRTIEKNGAGLLKPKRRYRIDVG
jgi:RimJ/RimL family protein N-acetyltransferase